MPVRRRTFRAVSRPVRVLLFVRFVNRLGAFSMAYLGAVLVLHNGVSVSVAGLITGLFGICTVVSRLLGGAVAAGYGTRNAIVLGLVGTAAGQLIIAAADSILIAAIGAALLGLFFEVYEPASQAMIAEETPPEHHAATFGLLGAIIAVAGVTSGLLAIVVGGIDLRWLFVIDAATCLVGAVIAHLSLSSLLDNCDHTRLFDGWRAAWADRQLLILLVTGSVFATVYMELTIATPLSLRAIGINPSWAGFLAAVGGIAMLAAQPLISRTGGTPARRMIVGYVVFAAGLGILAPATSFWPYLLAAVVCAVAELLLFSYGYSLIGAIAPEGFRPQYYAVYGLSWGVALTVGPPIASLLLEQGGPPLLWTSAALTMLTVGIAQAAAGRYISGAQVKVKVEATAMRRRG